MQQEEWEPKKGPQMVCRSENASAERYAKTVRWFNSAASAKKMIYSFRVHWPFKPFEAELDDGTNYVYK